MTDQQKRIEQLEKMAIESALIADLATDPEVRVYNARLAHELREKAKVLLEKLQPTMK